jgi:competence protein ComEC
MLFWTRFPFVRITIFFALGIWAGDFVALPITFHLIFWITAVLIYFLVTHQFVKEKFRKFNFSISLLAFFMVFISGDLLIQFQNDRKVKVEKTLQGIPVQGYLARIILPAGTTDRYQKTIAEINLVLTDSQTVILQGKILLYLPATTSIRYGDQLLVEGKPELISDPAFPFEFNYKKYMQRRGILYRQFVSEKKFILISKEKIPSLKSVAFGFREDLVNIIRERITDLRVQALMIAFTTGIRDYFDQETYDQFLGAGIVHILAVSGLHVGILYFLLVQLTRPLSFSRAGRWIRLVFILPFFLFFAFLTGLSPSVLRSVIMFSIMLLGKTFDRKSPVMNSVFLSAFLLLCFDPATLWRAGFQLSYSAVLGIILFHPLLQSLWHPGFRLLQWFRDLVAVSLSAQLATLPLTLLYFKQFPTYFMISNLFAIPFASFFMPGSILFIGTYSFIPLNRLISLLLDHTGRIFIQLIGVIHELPGSTIARIHIGSFDALFIFLIIILLYIILRYKKHRLFRYLLLLSGILVIKDAWHYFSSSGQNKILVYSISGAPVIELIDGHESIILLQNLNPAMEKKIDYVTGNFHIHHHIESRNLSFDNLPGHFPCYQRDGCMLICWNGKSILIQESIAYSKRINLIQFQPDYWFDKKQDRFELLFPQPALPVEKKSLIDRLFGIFRKNKESRIETGSELICIQFG